MTEVEKQLQSSLEFLEYRLGSTHKETVETRRLILAEWKRMVKNV